MTGPVSVHEYDLAEDVTEDQFREALREAEERDLFEIEGLADHRFVYGLRGTRAGKFAAIWFWESREVWEKLWGPVGEPVPKEDYPANWKIWEDEILEPLLSSDPDKLRYTAYQTVDA